MNYALFALVSALRQLLKNRDKDIRLWIKWNELVIEYTLVIKDGGFYLITPHSKVEVTSHTQFLEMVPKIEKIKFDNDIVYISDSDFVLFYEFDLKLLYHLTILKKSIDKVLKIGENVEINFNDFFYAIVRDGKEEEMMYYDEDDVIKQINLYKLENLDIVIEDIIQI